MRKKFDVVKIPINYNKKKILLANFILFLFVILLFLLRDIFNFDYVLVGIVIVMFISLLFYKPSIILKYFFSCFYSIFMLSGVFLCNNIDLYLVELGVNTKYNGSFGLAIIYIIIWFSSLIFFDNFFSKKFKYYLPENKYTKSTFFNNLIYKFMFAFGLFLFLLVIRNPSFLLNSVDRFLYRAEYLPAIASKFQTTYVYFVPFLVLPLVVGKDKINKKWIIKIFFVLLPFILYGFWTGNKFGLYLNIVILLLSPLTVLLMKGKIKFSKKESLEISDIHEQIIRKKIYKILPILFILFFAILIPYYTFRGVDAQKGIFTRVTQQGQLWWKTFELEKNEPYRLEELSDEINPLIDAVAGKDIRKSYGIYKIMNLTTPSHIVKNKLRSGSRYSAQGIEIAYYYMKNIGLILHAVLRGMVEAFLVCLLVKYVFSYRLIETWIIARFILMSHSIFTQGDLYTLFVKSALLALIILIFLEIMHKKKLNTIKNR